jgi:hypothetical protein
LVWRIHLRLAARAADVRGLQVTEWVRHSEVTCHPLVFFASRSENYAHECVQSRDTCRSKPSVRTTLPWSLDTLRRMRHLAATYTSVSVRQLCSAFRLSQPLDALLRSDALPALFHAGGAHGFFVFRGFLLRRSVVAFPRPLPSVSSSRPGVRKRPRGRDFEGVRISGVRHSAAGVTRIRRARASPDVVPFEVLSSSVSALRVTAWPPFLGFDMPLTRRNASSPCLLFKVSENRRGQPPLSR